MSCAQGAGNPLLDISAVVDAALLDKYGVRFHLRCSNWLPA